MAAQFVVKCTVRCDACGHEEQFQAANGDQLDELIEGHGWVRFGPSGQDLCWKCRCGSPNSTIQVRLPRP